MFSLLFCKQTMSITSIYFLKLKINEKKFQEYDRNCTHFQFNKLLQRSYMRN